jgi:molybdopterin-binding protein
MACRWRSGRGREEASVETMTADQAAGFLQLHPKSVRALARAGKIPGARVGRRWLFRRDDLERLLESRRSPAARPVDSSAVGARSVELSARNRLRGRVVRLHLEGLMAEVVLAIGDQTLVSIITRSSAERMALAEGQDVYAVVKSTEVMIGKDGPFA